MASMQDFLQRQKPLAPILNKIKKYGIMEIHQNKHIYFASNSIDNNYKLSKDSIFVTKYTNNVDSSAINHSINFIIERDGCIFNKELDIKCGFYYCEKLENKDIQRNYFFGAKNYGIYDDIVNNIQILKEFIELFKFINSDITTYFAEHNLEGKLFREPNSLSGATKKEIFETCLQASNQDIGAFLNINKNDTENNSKRINHKFNIK